MKTNLENIQTKKTSDLMRSVKSNKFLILLFLPGLIWFILFKFVPMGGIIIAFKDYSIWKGIWDSPWAGLHYFKVFANTPTFFRLFRNTILLNLYNLIFGFPAPIILALLLNEVRKMKFKRIVQTITYVPHFVSKAIIVGILVTFLSPSTGIVNIILTQVFGIKPIWFMGESGWFRPLYIITEIWQELGFKSIIFLAAIAGIDQTLYEVCRIDGGGRLRQLWHVTLPGILPTLMIMTILQIGKMMNVSSSKILLMYNPLTYETADVYETYVYRIGLMGANFSLGTAVGLFNNAIGFILLVLANFISRRVTEYSLW